MNQLGNANVKTLLPPLAALLVYVGLIIHLYFFVDLIDLVGDQPFGPTSWPKVALIGLVICTVWLLLKQLVPGRTTSCAEPNPADVKGLDRRSVGLALLLITVYGVAAVYLGFAFATLVFLVLWLRLGGFRSFYIALLNSAAITVVLLYVFTLVVYMPLPRGRGIFDLLTIKLYQLLGIF